MSTLRTAIIAQLKRRRNFDTLAENIDLPRSEIMRYLIQNTENNPLTKGEPLRQIKKILGVKENWQVLLGYPVVLTKRKIPSEIPLFENMRTKIVDAECANTETEELIKITEQNGQRAVSARELHAFLGNKRDFSNWIKSRIKQYGLIENEDYVLLNKIVEQTGRGGHNKKEYALSIDCAKELAMVEGNEQGKRARRYFIAAEKALRSKEVLPAIRRTGAYQIKKRNHNTPVPAGSDIARLLRLIADNLQKNDKAAVATQLGIARASVSNIFRKSAGKQAKRIYQCLFQRVRGRSDHKIRIIINYMKIWIQI